MSPEFVVGGQYSKQSAEYTEIFVNMDTANAHRHCPHTQKKKKKPTEMNKKTQNKSLLRCGL